MNDLAIISAFFNFENHQSRIDNLKTFLKFMTDSGQADNLFIAEVLHPSQRPSISHKNVITLYCNSLLWQKEAALNELAKILPSHYTKIMWVDADIIWFNKNWYNDISELLNEYKMVQPFSYCKYLNKDFTVANTGISYVAFHMNHENGTQSQSLLLNHGMALAYHRDFYTKFGLCDKFIYGGGDCSMVIPPVVGIDKFEQKCSPNFDKTIWCDILKYASDTATFIGTSYSYYNSEIIHLYHGELINRRYNGRTKNMSGISFQESFVKNEYGLYESVSSSAWFKYDFFHRFEDSPQHIGIVSKMEYPIEHGDISYMWIPDEIRFEFVKIRAVRLYFSRHGNPYTSSYLNLIYDNGTFNQITFDIDGELCVEASNVRWISINSSYFIPSELDSNSTDNRKLSCILYKIEVKYDDNPYEIYPLEYLFNRK